jgi:hypothetical protein
MCPHYIALYTNGRSADSSGSSRHEFDAGYTSQIDQFLEFLAKSCYRPLALFGSSSSSSSSSASSTTASSGSVVLLEDLPSVQEMFSSSGSSSANDSKRDKLRAALQQFIHSSPHPVVLIMSEAADKGAALPLLESLLGTELAHAATSGSSSSNSSSGGYGGTYSSAAADYDTTTTATAGTTAGTTAGATAGLVHLVAVNTVSATALRVALRTIAQDTGLTNNGALSELLLEEIVETCGGDIRHAVLTLQVIQFKYYL